MCEGTRCTHHVNPAVEDVESDYNSWEYVRTPFFDTPNGTVTDDMMPSVYLVSVSGRNYRPDMSNGPSHDSPMIMYKDDIGKARTDADMRRLLYCIACKEDCHKCYGCGIKVTHMSASQCQDCIERTHLEFLSNIRERLQ